MLFSEYVHKEFLECQNCITYHNFDMCVQFHFKITVEKCDIKKVIKKQTLFFISSGIMHIGLFREHQQILAI